METQWQREVHYSQNLEEIPVHWTTDDTARPKDKNSPVHWIRDDTACAKNKTVQSTEHERIPPARKINTVQSHGTREDTACPKDKRVQSTEHERILLVRTHVETISRTGCYRVRNEGFEPMRYGAVLMWKASTTRQQLVRWSYSSLE